MRISRILMGVTLAGVMVFTAVPRAQAMDPYTQGLLSQLLSGYVLGTPYGAPSALPAGGYGISPYDPYGNSPYGPYQRPGYGSYGAPPPTGPYGTGGGYGLPLPGAYSASPPPDYRSRGYGYAYPNRRSYDYAKAMNRLDRQEAEAMAKAARHSYGNPARYNDRMAKVESKYAYKRYKVERNTGYGYGYR